MLNSSFVTLPAGCNDPDFMAPLHKPIDEALQGIFHASGCERISRYEFAKRIAETFGLESGLIKPIKMSELTAWIAKRPKDSSLSTEKVQKQLKTKPLNITEGLNKMKQEMEA